MTDMNNTQLRDTIATACRVLGHLGLARETTGHVSARVGSNRMLIRCRGSDEAGIVFTVPEVVREVDFDGRDPEGDAEFEKPSELPIHGEILRLRPDVNAVVHCHPKASMICSLLGLDLQPIFGSFDPTASALAAAGIPTYQRSILIRSKSLAHDLVEALGDKSVCLMKGHGIVAVGDTVEEATLNAIRLETLASISLEVLKAGGQLISMPDEDLSSLNAATRRAGAKSKPRQGNWAWRHYVKLMEGESK